MEFYWVLIALLVIFPVAVIVDKRMRNKVVKESDAVYGDFSMDTVLLMLIPLLTLFYVDEFWFNLVCLLPLYFYLWALTVYLGKSAWFDAGKVIIFLGVLGGFVMTILAYFIFFKLL